MNDRRNIRTEKLIKEVFLNILKTKDITKITVSEISKEANLGRGTFYLHFDDVYDLYESIENDVLKNLKSIFESSFPTIDSNNSFKLASELVSYIEENKDIFKIIVNSNARNTIYKIKKYFYDSVFDENAVMRLGIDKQYSLIESVFVVSGIIGTLEKWIIDDFKVEKEEMAKMMNTIIFKINSNYHRK